MPDYLIIVSARPDSADQRERIVRARNESSALKHVIADTITIDRATIDDAMRLAKEGVEVEVVK